MLSLSNTVVHCGISDCILSKGSSQFWKCLNTCPLDNARLKVYSELTSALTTLIKGAGNNLSSKRMYIQSMEHWQKNENGLTLVSRIILQKIVSKMRYIAVYEVWGIIEYEKRKCYNELHVYRIHIYRMSSKQLVKQLDAGIIMATILPRWN